MKQISSYLQLAGLWNVDPDPAVFLNVDPDLQPWLPLYLFLKCLLLCDRTRPLHSLHAGP